MGYRCVLRNCQARNLIACIDTDVELPTLGDLPRADDVIQAIKDWLSHLFGDIFGYTKDIPEFIHRNGKLVADHIGILAGQVEDFVKAHPKEIAYAVGGFLISVALLIFFGPTVLLALGFGILGPVAGGLAATLQSIAMGGSAVVVLNLQVFAVLSVIVGLGLILYFTLHG
ncbi:hypothetical protein CALCODRAFT_18383 [Calocera cornea HHB12733]|uniref:Uncharacterized protein n=1 Tax=Calocera cornea HHB12733 TaxID=1353952 RepID=A0A165E8E1_9BASI|nr:hypothetical protein CALCODRAFT_18383 [Calocera cornea HHB12733]